ncbi:hypothetical protein BN1723_011280 [Verticillium longisporum]|uniref:Response regulatory domain-containing protein n=1 Tax=Verticillium longisporum TaxID=100787 RepID=A0A0G4L5S1_VERLO|nr:hypothetical protein BN1723_011280 [Verticillium longisporum]
MGSDLKARLKAKFSRRSSTSGSVKSGHSHSHGETQLSQRDESRSLASTDNHSRPASVRLDPQFSSNLGAPAPDADEIPVRIVISPKDSTTTSSSTASTSPSEEVQPQESVTRDPSSQLSAAPKRRTASDGTGNDLHHPMAATTSSLASINEDQTLVDASIAASPPATKLPPSVSTSARNTAASSAGETQLSQRDESRSLASTDNHSRPASVRLDPQSSSNLGAPAPAPDADEVPVRIVISPEDSTATSSSTASTLPSEEVQPQESVTRDPSSQLSAAPKRRAASDGPGNDLHHPMAATTSSLASINENQTLVDASIAASPPATKLPPSVSTSARNTAASSAAAAAAASAAVAVTAAAADPDNDDDDDDHLDPLHRGPAASDVLTPAPATAPAPVPATLSASSIARPTGPPRRQSLLPNRQDALIKTLLQAANINEADLTADHLLSINANMVTRKIWVKRAGASATLITINEDDLVDDVRDMILKKYTNSLGRHFDAPDLTLRIFPREERQERLLENATGHDVNEPELGLDGAETLLGDSTDRLLLDDLDAEVIVGITVETLVSVGRDFVLPVSLGDRRADIVGVETSVGLSVVQAKDGAVLDVDGVQVIPSIGAVDRQAIDIKRLRLVLQHPDVVVILVGVQGDLLLLAAGGDNPINLKLLEAFVKRLKVRWKTAMNGRDAVKKWKGGGFHLVLMDIQLPIMNGLDATKEIRRLERVNSIGVFSSSASGVFSGSVTSEPEGTEGDIEDKDRLANIELFKSPVIIVALTASSLQSDRHEALAAGCNDFLTKPVNFVWLERKVMEWGCMQALIDFDGWRQWKDFAQDAEENDAAKKAAGVKAKSKKNRLSVTTAAA